MVCHCHPINDAPKADSMLAPSSSLWRMDSVHSVCLFRTRERQEKGRKREGKKLNLTSLQPVGTKCQSLLLVGFSSFVTFPCDEAHAPDLQPLPCKIAIKRKNLPATDHISKLKEEIIAERLGQHVGFLFSSSTVQYHYMARLDVLVEMMEFQGNMFCLRRKLVQCCH